MLFLAAPSPRRCRPARCERAAHALQGALAWRNTTASAQRDGWGLWGQGEAPRASQSVSLCHLRVSSQGIFAQLHLLTAHILPQEP